jgi:radical SAM protein with 4Fe4S-binding SPASM domain
MSQVGKYIIQLDLYNWGEPFINRDIFKIIRHAKKFKIRVEISSNLNFYNEKLGRKIIKSGLDTLILSIHGKSAETYSKYMVGGNFDQVMKNLNHLIKLREQLGSKRPTLRWRFVVFRHNQHEVERVAELAKKMGVDEFEPLPMKMDVGFDVATIKRSIRKKRNWIPTREEFNLYNVARGERKKKELDCFWPWEMMSIGAKGAVQPCCVFYNQKFDFGNVFTEPFSSVWNNHYYQISRKVLREKIKNNNKTICGPCLASDFLAK